MKQNYSQIINRLFSVNQLEGMKFGLKNSHDLHRLLENPSHAFQSIHVAGTNGKGSVSTKIAAAYETAGHKVGLYTSPHLSCFRERIRINGEMISEKQVEAYMNTLFSLCDEHRIKATFFELTTMMALTHFARENVDMAVLETGLGGRLDSTNIVKPKLSIITSISLDHTEILGSTIEEIAREKAGIIKPSVPIILGPRVPLPIIEPIALENNSPCTQVNGTFSDYHEENCAIAKQALETLKISKNAIAIGLKALPPCRLQMFTANDLLAAGFSHPLPKMVILDVAHNPDGFHQLLKAVRKRYPAAPLRFVLGLSSNKDIVGCLDVVKNAASAFHLVEGANGRATPKEFLARELSALGVKKDMLFYESSIASGIHHAIKLAGEKKEIVVTCGSFFIMAEARKALGIYEIQDILFI